MCRILLEACITIQFCPISREFELYVWILLPSMISRIHSFAKMTVTTAMPRTLAAGESGYREKRVFILNRGHIFKLPLSAVFAHPFSRLAKDCGNALLNGAQDFLHLEYHRNTQILELVIDFYLKGRLHYPRDICWESFEEELMFWNVSSDMVDHCCMRAYRDAGTVKRTTNTIKKSWEAHMGVKLEDLGRLPELCLSLSRRMWLFLEDPGSHPTAKVMKAHDAIP